MASVVSPIMPPMIPVPMEWRAFAPAPVAIASGSTPKMKASDVMRIGRSRSSPAWMVASMIDSPCFRSSTAKVTRRTAFFAPRPISTSRPIWKYTSLFKPRSQLNARAPRMPKGTAVMTEPGRVHDSNWAARTRKTMMRPKTKAAADVPPDFFSSYAMPDQEKSYPCGRTSWATSSIALIASPGAVAFRRRCRSPGRPGSR